MQRQRPCPKRFKKPLALIQLPNIPESNDSQKSSQSVSEKEMLLNVENEASSEALSRSSASIEQEPPTESCLQQNSDPLSSKEIPKQQAVALDVPSSSATAISHPVSVQTAASNKPRPKTRVQYDSDSLSDPDSPSRQTRNQTINRQIQHASTIQNNAQSSSATAQTTVRTINRNRQVQGSTVQDTIQSSSAPAVKNPRVRQDNSSMPRNLQQYFSVQNFSVSNYSRSLAG